MIRVILTLILLSAAAYAITEAAFEGPKLIEPPRAPDIWEQHFEGTSEPLVPIGPRKL